MGYIKSQAPAREDTGRLGAVNSVPHRRQDIADGVADDGGENDDRRRSARIERPRDDRHLEHVRPKREINERLRPPQDNEQRPHDMPPTDNNRTHEPGFFRICTHTYIYELVMR